VNGCGLAKDKVYRGVHGTILHTFRSDGVSVLFRGLLITMSLIPLSGVWWVLYERCKRIVYRHADSLIGCVPYAHQIPCSSSLRSRTDNPAINSSVGAVVSGTMSVIMNPLLVLRTRIQTVESRSLSYVLRDLIRMEGPSALFKGLKVSLCMGCINDPWFGVFYESMKLLADNSST